MYFFWFRDSDNNLILSKQGCERRLYIAEDIETLD